MALDFLGADQQSNVSSIVMNASTGFTFDPSKYKSYWLKLYNYSCAVAEFGPQACLQFATDAAGNVFDNTGKYTHVMDYAARWNPQIAASPSEIATVSRVIPYRLTPQGFMINLDDPDDPSIGTGADISIDSLGSIGAQNVNTTIRSFAIRSVHDPAATLPADLIDPMQILSSGYYTGAPGLPIRGIKLLDSLNHPLTARVELYGFNSSGVSVGGGTPAVNFSAYLPSNQALSSGVLAKIMFTAEEFDSNNWYDAANARFTPQLAGKYRVTLQYIGTGSDISIACARIYKNGLPVREDSTIYAGGVQPNMMVTGTIPMNGTTDYLEGWGYITGTNPAIAGGNAPQYSWFCAEYAGA